MQPDGSRAGRPIAHALKDPQVSRRIATIVLGLCLASGAFAVGLPPGFQDEVVLTGLQAPTAVRFSPDGRVFVAEKSGLIQVFDGLGDPTPTVFADLRRQVFNVWDRGLLGFVLHPDFPVTPWAYALYTHNALPGGADPQWPSSGPDYTYDYCPDPPGVVNDGCVATGRLSRLEVVGPTQVIEHVLVENNWCQQFPSHSVGDLAFGPDGALYVSAGDGANFFAMDWGQYGGASPDPILAPIPRNPCGDPPGDAMTPPTAEGGALRAQDLRTAGDPVSYGGTILRLDPETGAALPDNPLWGGAVADDDRVVAFGLRNPFRLAVRPGTTELWIGDVGWETTEEIDRLVDPTSLSLSNFGWPCWEGNSRQPLFDGANLALCETLYADQTDTKPFLGYRHDTPLGDDACASPAASVSGLTFYAGGTFPGEYAGALFFADYARGCMWVMPAGADGVPDPAAVVTFATDLLEPVSLERGPGGDLFYLEVGGSRWSGGTVHRIRYTGSNHPPMAVATADVTTGASPLRVHFDGSASSDPDPGDALAFAWDLDGDGEFDDADGPTPTFTFGPGSYRVRLRVSDDHGASQVAALTVSVDNTRPTALISMPSPSVAWNVGQPITFAGSGLDAEEGTLPDSALRWQIVMLHCPGFDCHVHAVEELVGVAGGVFVAPDHEYPSFLELVLTVIDAGGLSHTTSMQLQPRTATLRFDSVPSGLALAVGATAGITPFARNVIVGSQTSVAALSPQMAAGTEYTFASWSDGAPEAHNVLARAGGGSWVVHFGGGVCGNGLRDDGEACDDGNRRDDDCCTNACALPPLGSTCFPTTTTTTTTTTPDIPSTTTTSTITPTTTTSTTTTAPGTPDPPPTTTTSTTLPERCAGDAQCDDGDPCTVDRCGVGGCTALPLSGVEGAQCAVERVSSGLCAPGDLDPAFSGFLRKRVQAARRSLLAAGATASAARRAKLLRAADRALASIATRSAKIRTRRSLPGACAGRIGQAVEAARQAARLVPGS